MKLLRWVFCVVIYFCILFTWIQNSFAWAWQYNVQQVDSRITSCDTSITQWRPASVREIIYINWANKSESVWDEYISTVPKLMSDRSTDIRIWESDSWLITGCKNSSDWIKYSEYAPSNTWVAAMAANCTFNKPTDVNKRNVQFVFNLWLYTLGSWNWSRDFVHASKSQANNWVWSSTNLQNVWLWDFERHSNECLDIELRYCGDAILEPENGEVCDPEDPLGIWFGNGGCNVNTCQPINNPVCNGLTVDKTTGEAPTNVVATCEWFKVNNWKIDCGNGQVFTGNGNNAGDQTFTRTCNYNTGRDYNPTCTINNTITSNSCQKTVNITNPEASITVDKRDANVFDLDTNDGNDTQTVRTWEEAIFKIRVTNNGEEALKEIKLTDNVERSCATKDNTFVNLAEAKFTNVNNAMVSITFWGQWDSNNSVLDVWEWFEYTCEKWNTTSNYTNEVRVDGVGIISGDEVDADDETVVEIAWEPSIIIYKGDDNPNDLDDSRGWNDSQTVGVWEQAIFRITVVNNGAEDLENISLIDTIAPSCASDGNVDLIAKSFKNNSNATVNISVSWAWNHNDDIFQVGERFTYLCAKSNTQSEYTNVATVTGVWVVTGDDVTSTNSTEVILDTQPDIWVVKDDANSGDIDGEQYNDTQTVLVWDDAIFSITIENTWNEDLKDIIISDPRSPACGTKLWTFVDLSTGTFVNDSDVTVWVIYLENSPGNHADNILQVWEQFTYMCSSPNTQSSYTNVVNVDWVWVQTWDPADGTDPSEVVVEEVIYDVALIKTLSNATPGPFYPGEEVTFNIIVRNQWNVDAEVSIIDYIPNGLSLADTNWQQSDSDTANPNGIAYYTQNPISIWAFEDDVVTQITFTIDDDVVWQIANFAEIFSDNWTDCDSTPDTTNGNGTNWVGETTNTGLDNDLFGMGCEEWGDEDDHDIEVITVEIPEPYLVKSLASGQDTLVNVWDTVNYVITVFNTTSVDIMNQRIEDHFSTASNGSLSLVPSTDWIETNGVAEYKELVDIPANGSLSFDISFTINDNATGQVRNNAVVCDENEEDCTPVEPPVCDDESEVWTPDGCVIVDIEEYDLALRKTVSSTGPFNTWDTITFEIRVFNQGNVDSGEVEITDYIPNGLTLNDDDWTMSGGNAVRTITNIPAGENTPLSITFTIDSDAPKNIDNFAEISDDSGDDCDSNPDSTNGWDETGETTGLVDNEIGSRCDEIGDEDDHDIAPIVVEDGLVGVCNTLSASPGSARNSLTTTLTCTWTNVGVYKIEVKDESGAVIETINAATGEVTIGTPWTYSASCLVDGATSAPNSCRKTLTVTTGWSSGSTHRCNDIIQEWPSVTCVWNSKVKSFKLECGTGEDQTVFYKNATTNWASGRNEAVFTCGEAVAECFVYDEKDTDESDTWAAWRAGSDNVCKTSLNPFCGDGIVGLRADGSQEICDLWSENGSGEGCTAQCTLPGGWSWNPDDDGSITTTPTGGEIVFGPFGITVVWHDKNVIEHYKVWNQTVADFPYIQNMTEYDYSFDQLCIKKTSGDDSVLSASLGNNEACVDISHKMLYGFEKFVIAQRVSNGAYVALSGHQIDDDQLLTNPQYTYPDFMSDKDEIPDNADFGQAVLTTTMKHDIDRNGTIDDLYSAYFAADLNVRVAKPSIATIGWGTSFVNTKDSSNNLVKVTGDIQAITDGVSGLENNTNFVWVSVGESGVSSAVETNTETDVITDTQSQKDDFTEDVADVVTVSAATVPDKDYGDFENFNGLDNVYIIKWANVTFGSISEFDDVPTLDDITKPTTFIVEGGNLTLTKDIVTDQNIAFVVKGGDIKIQSNVEKLSGTYIAIPVNWNGWKITSSASNKQLVVQGSLLWNLTELVSNRFYIERTGNQLSVGTIVSFGSRLLSRPAPLVSQFKSEYNASQKVAR